MAGGATPAGAKDGAGGEPGGGTRVGGDGGDQAGRGVARGAQDDADHGGASDRGGEVGAEARRVAGVERAGDVFGATGAGVGERDRGDVRGVHQGAASTHGERVRLAGR